jgi:hypothetical protein
MNSHGDSTHIGTQVKPFRSIFWTRVHSMFSDELTHYNTLL